MEEKIEAFEEIIKENLHPSVDPVPSVEHIEKPIGPKTFPEEEILLKRMTAEPSEFPNATVEAIDGTGSIGVEMFLTKNNEVIVNEMAPRVHNTGHYTIEACETSQFENHVRAVLGLPLGSTRMVAPAAVMINMLGNKEGNGFPTGIEKALAINGVHIHVYGKTTTRIGRKMGHVTALGSCIAEAENVAIEAATSISFGKQK